MAISNIQRRRDALQKRWPGLKESGRSIRRVTVALIFFIVTPLSLEVMADRYRYPLGDIELGRVIERPTESLQADVAAMVGLS